MGAIYAELHVAGRVFPLRRCTYGVSQATGPRGRPIQQVVHHGIDGEMDVPRDPFLEHWAAESYLPLDGYVIFSGGPGEPAIETVSWEAGHCVGYREVFNAGSMADGSYICQWRIVAAKLVFSVGPPKPFVAPAPREHGTPVALLAARPVLPVAPPVPAVLPLNKQGRYNARMLLMQRAGTGLAATPNPAAQTALDRLARNNVAVERARLSAHVYKSTDIPPVPEPEGWHMLNAKELAKRGITPGMLVDKKSGFKAAVYQSSFERPPKLVIAYAGTKMTSISDWGANLKQGMGLKSKQYNSAMDLATALTENMGKGAVETTGHSLGGGQAAAASVVTGTKSYTFNAAGLHARTVGRKPYSISRQAMKEKGALIDTYHSTSDPLTTLQLASVVTRGVVLPHALGVAHAITPAPHWQHHMGDLVKGIPGKDLWDRFMDGHSIAPQMVDHIEHEKDQDTATLTNFIAR